MLCSTFFAWWLRTPAGKRTGDAEEEGDDKGPVRQEGEHQRFGGGGRREAVRLGVRARVRGAVPTHRCLLHSSISCHPARRSPSQGSVCAGRASSMSIEKTSGSLFIRKCCRPLLGAAAAAAAS